MGKAKSWSPGRFFSSLLVVMSAGTAQDGAWREVAARLVARHGAEMRAEVAVADQDGLSARLREAKPRYVAFVMKDSEVDAKRIASLRQTMRAIDDDPFEDAIWSIVTGTTAADAMRIATSEEPREITRVLATTGVDENIVPGPVAVISDSSPNVFWWEKAAGGGVTRQTEDGDVSHVFADAWGRLDPDLILTSSHASERNLEMPFSRGNIVASGGAFAMLPQAKLIDYSTGQALSEDARGPLPEPKPLAAPAREKVWIAAGNCLIANHIDRNDMVMTALSFGKVNLFFGYATTTWFGAIGWNTWRYFGQYGYTLGESHYAANQVLIKRIAEIEAGIVEAAAAKMAASGGGEGDVEVELSEEAAREYAGLLWDRDATVLYGDPLHGAHVPGRATTAASRPGDPPMLVVFPEAKAGRRLVSAPEGFEVFVADDFALVTAWPELTADWKSLLVFE